MYVPTEMYLYHNKRITSWREHYLGLCGGAEEIKCRTRSKTEKFPSAKVKQNTGLSVL